MTEFFYFIFLLCSSNVFFSLLPPSLLFSSVSCESECTTYFLGLLSRCWGLLFAPPMTSRILSRTPAPPARPLFIRAASDLLLLASFFFFSFFFC